MHLYIVLDDTYIVEIVGMIVDNDTMEAIRAKYFAENDVDIRYPQIVFLKDMMHVTSMEAVQNSLTFTPPNSSRQASICNGTDDNASATSSANKTPFSRASVTMSVISCRGLL